MIQPIPMPPARHVFAVGVRVRPSKSMPSDVRKVVGRSVCVVQEVFSPSILVVRMDGFGVIWSLKTDWRIA